MIMIHWLVYCFIKWLILCACQIRKGYFMCRVFGIAFILHYHIILFVHYFRIILTFSHSYKSSIPTEGKKLHSAYSLDGPLA